MPVKGPVPWDRAEHTAAKHDLYRRYLHRWFPIILSQDSWDSATYAEGFAGPGVYSGGEDGSPVIAIRAYSDEVSNPSKSANFVFVDDDERCIDKLKAHLRAAFPRRPKPMHQMTVAISEGRCGEALPRELDKIGAWTKPILAIFDSWGNAPVPYCLLERIAGNPGSEVVVTLEPQYFVRFVTELGDDANEIFGGNAAWRDAAALESTEKRRFILGHYRDSLQRAGFSYLLDFELVDSRGNALYLIFGTNHQRGVEKMKDSLWEVDRAHGIGFRDPRDSQMEALFELDEPQLSPLTRILHARLREVAECRIEDLRRFALFETVFRPEHVIRSMSPLLHSGHVTVDGGGTQLRRASIVRINNKVR